MNTIKPIALQAVSIASVMLLSLSNFAIAKCIQIPSPLKLQCQGAECLNGILWKSDDNNAKYHPKIEWTSGSEGSKSSQFEIVAVDQTRQQAVSVKVLQKILRGVFLLVIDLDSNFQ